MMLWWHGSSVYGMFGHGIWWIWHFTGFIVFWLVLNALGVIALQRFMRPRLEGTEYSSRKAPGIPPMSILEERYARGEIGRDEFMEKQRDLGATGS